MVQGPWCPCQSPGLLSSLPVSMNTHPLEQGAWMKCFGVCGVIQSDFRKVPLSTASQHQHLLTNHFLHEDPTASRGFSAVDTGSLELCDLWPWVGMEVPEKARWDLDRMRTWPIPIPHWLW